MTITNLIEAREWVQKKYHVIVKEAYYDRINSAYDKKRVGYICVLNGAVFFMRFRQNLINMSKHYPHVPSSGMGFGFNRSEIERQQYGLKSVFLKALCEEVWCMIVRPDHKVYVCHPKQILDFIDKFNTIKRPGELRGINEDEDILNVPFKLFINIEDWLQGKTESDFNWRELTQTRFSYAKK